jgi:hypothetical protein
MLVLIRRINVISELYHGVTPAVNSTSNMIVSLHGIYLSTHSTVATRDGCWLLRAALCHGPVDMHSAAPGSACWSLGPPQLSGTSCEWGSRYPPVGRVDPCWSARPDGRREGQSPRKKQRCKPSLSRQSQNRQTDRQHVNYSTLYSSSSHYIAYLTNSFDPCVRSYRAHCSS